MRIYFQLKLKCISIPLRKSVHKNLHYFKWKNDINELPFFHNIFDNKKSSLEPSLGGRWHAEGVTDEGNMGLPRNQILRKKAQSLRKNLTKEERHLWYDFLKNYPVQFSRQKVIGSYIVDFYCHKAQLIVELDGSQHYEDGDMEYDANRTKYLNSLGLFVLRIPNNEVWDSFSSVCETIDLLVKERVDPHQSARG